MTFKTTKELEKEIEELRVYLNNPLDSSQDITDLSLRQIIDLEIDNKGYLIDYIEFEKLQAELKGFEKGSLSKQKEVLKIIDSMRNLDNPDYSYSNKYIDNFMEELKSRIEEK